MLQLLVALLLLLLLLLELELLLKLLLLLELLELLVAQFLLLLALLGLGLGLPFLLGLAFGFALALLLGLAFLLGLQLLLLLVLLHLFDEFAFAHVRRGRGRRTDVHRRWAALRGKAGFDFLLLLEGFHEGRLEAVRVLGLERLLHVARYALLADDFGVLADWRILKSGISSFTLFLPFPDRGEVDLALGAAVRLLRRALLLVLGQIVDDVLEPEQVHKLGVARVRDEVHLRRRRLGRGNLKQRLLELLPQG